MSRARPVAARLQAGVLVLAGIVAASNIGKLPSALPALQSEFGLSLVQVSWMVSLFMIGGALLGVVGGSLADRFDARRVMIVGLVLSACSGALGAVAGSAALLFTSRALESLGFLMTALPGPALIARSVPGTSLRGWLAVWSAYMPAGMGLSLLLSPALMSFIGWRGVWLACAAAGLACAALVAFTQPSRPSLQRGAEPFASGVAATLRSPGPWLLASCFAFYAGQFMGIFSFLPTVYNAAGLSLQAGASLTALAVLVNMAGNLGAGALMQRRVDRSLVIAAAGATMALCEWLAFGSELPFVVRYAAILLLSAAGGLIPGVLFATAPFYAPSLAAASTTIGLMQQGSSAGQLLLPPVIAALAQHSGGWQSTWIATGACALATVAIAGMIARYDRLRRRERARRQPA